MCCFLTTVKAQSLGRQQVPPVLTRCCGRLPAWLQEHQPRSKTEPSGLCLSTGLPLSVITLVVLACGFQKGHHPQTSHGECAVFGTLFCVLARRHVILSCPQLSHCTNGDAVWCICSTNAASTTTLPSFLASVLLFPVWTSIPGFDKQ